VTGDGIGTVTLSAGGTVALAGTLADGTVIGQTAPVSREGWWPLYVPLYTGKGMLISWVQFETNGSRSLNGDAVWTRNPVPGRYLHQWICADDDDRRRTICWHRQ